LDCHIMKACPVFLIAFTGLASAHTLTSNRTLRGAWLEVSIGSANFSVAANGALGDGKSDDTTAIQKAIDACVSSGGMVVFDVGTYLTRSLALKGSHCALYLPVGATVKFDDDMSKYDQSSNLIDIEGSDVAVIGGGIFNGQGPKWWACRDKGCWRPRLLSVSHSKRVLLQGITWKDSPNHVLEMYSDFTELDHVTVFAPPSESTVKVNGTKGPSHNTDAVDVHGTPFYIHDCHFDTGDDNVAVHASHLLVENCRFGHGHGASIGSCGDDTKLENITFRNIVFNGTTAAMKIKTHAGAKKAYVRDCVWENLVLHNVQATVTIDMFYDHGKNESTDFDISNITVRNVTAYGSKDPETGKKITPGSLHCQKSSPCRNIRLENIHHVDSKEPFSCYNAYGAWDDVSPIPCLKPEHTTA